MLGLFDSGMGGINTVRYLKRTGDDSDLIYLIDRQNAPYGIKTEEEILEITKSNIKVLTAMGAERVLIACCTASTVHGRLPDKERGLSVPIVGEVAKRAKELTRTGRVGVIATDHTVRTHAFAREMPSLFVTELGVSELVGMIDGGLCDLTARGTDRERIENIIRPVLTSGIDTLILGCTHFPAIIRTVGEIAKKYGDISLVDSAKVGAEILRGLKT